MVQLLVEGSIGGKEMAIGGSVSTISGKEMAIGGFLSTINVSLLTIGGFLSTISATGVDYQRFCHLNE